VFALGDLCTKVTKHLTPFATPVLQQSHIGEVDNGPQRTRKTLPQGYMVELMDLFSSDEVAEKWFAEQRWPSGPVCPHCGSFNVQSGAKHRTMTHRCRDCPDRRFFSLKTGTIYQPRKAELAADMSIPTTPEELAIAKAVVRDVTVVKRRP